MSNFWLSGSSVGDGCEFGGVWSKEMVVMAIVLCLCMECRVDLT
jgi:hypothetical protein